MTKAAPTKRTPSHNKPASLVKALNPEEEANLGLALAETRLKDGDAVLHDAELLGKGSIGGLVFISARPAARRG